MSTTTTATLSPKEIYDRVMADNGQTPADKLAEELGFKGHQKLLQAVTMYLVTVQNTTGEMPPFPRFNVELPKAKKSMQNVIGRTKADAKLQIGHTKLKELGDFDQVSSFEAFADKDGNLVLKPLARFSGEAPQPNPTPAASSTPEPGSSSTSTSEGSSSGTTTEAAPTPVAATVTVTPEGLDEIPAPTVTPAAQVPVAAALGDDDDEDGLNPNMI